MQHAIDTVYEDARWEEAGLEAWALRAADAVMTHAGIEAAECVVLACDDARIAELNGDFRDKPAATNVLSWPSQERGAEADGGPPRQPELDPGGMAELGDIAIAYETCVREAAQAGKSLEAHATHLIVHGILHLLGYDHERDADASLMEALEVEILGKLGIDDPYYMPQARDPAALDGLDP